MFWENWAWSCFWLCFPLEYMKEYARDQDRLRISVAIKYPWPTSPNRGWPPVTMEILDIHGYCQISIWLPTVARRQPQLCDVRHRYLIAMVMWRWPPISISGPWRLSEYPAWAWLYSEQLESYFSMTKGVS